MRRSNARTVKNCDNNHQKAGKMDPMKLQHRPNRPGYKNPYKQYTKSGLILYASIAFVSVFLCCILFFLNRSSYKSYGHKKYGIVIDGGSTGTRIHVFNYEVQNGILKYDFGKNGLASMKVNPGLSAYAEEPERAGDSVEELVAFGRKRVPREYWREAEIRLMATAGMRMLENDVQERILEACRRVLRGSGFRFRDDWAAVISGSDEGVYAWVVANYALGSLGGDPRQTTGIIELGGASAQVTFVSEEPLPPEYSRTVEYGNLTYNLYSHSLLQFGQNVAFDLLRESLLTKGQELASDSLESGKLTDPCTPRGYTHDTGAWKTLPSSLTEKSRYLSALNPSGNFSECRSASLMMLQKGTEKCSYPNCCIGSTFIPKLQGKFLATENFFHTSKFFGLGPQAFLSGLMVAGKRFCEADWSELKRKYYSLDEEDLLRYCFSSAYIVALLHDSLGIALDDERIGYANQVENISLDWALGAFILQSTTSVDIEHSPSIASYAHRKCVQHLCNEKGDIICEICHQPYQPAYTAPRPNLEETTIDIGGGWQLSGTPLDLHDTRLLAIAEAERQLLEAVYDDYNATNASGAAFCRSAALILMALLLLRHALTVTDGDGEDDPSAFFSLFLLRAAGFLLPCYIMVWAVSFLQRQEAAALAATQFAFVVQSGQSRGAHFAIASAAPVPSAAAALAPQQEHHS